MQFKKWLEDIGSRPTGAEYSTAGEFPTAGLVSGGGHGGGFDNWGNRYEVPKRKKKLPPLGYLGSKPDKDTRPPKDNLTYNTLMNSGGAW